MPLVGAPACIGSVRGTVGGQDVPPVQSGLWYWESAADPALISAQAYDFGSACGRMSQWQEGVDAAGESGEDLAAALETLDEEVFPTAWFGVRFTLAPPEPSDPTGSYAVPDGGVDGVLRSGEYQGELCWRDGRTDWSAVLAGGDGGMECYRAAAGDLVVTGWEPEGVATLDGDIELVDGEGAPAGAVAVSLALRWCGDAEGSS